MAYVADIPPPCPIHFFFDYYPSISPYRRRGIPIHPVMADGPLPPPRPPPRPPPFHPLEVEPPPPDPHPDHDHDHDHDPLLGISTPPSTLTAADQSHDPSHDPSPPPFPRECLTVLTTALPLVSQHLLSYLLSVISILFLGHLGPGPLAGVILGNSLFNVAGVSIMIGLAQALETLCSQAYGGGEPGLMGIYLQRSLAISSAASLPIVMLLLNAERILVACHQPPATAQVRGGGGEIIISEP